MNCKNCGSALRAENLHLVGTLAFTRGPGSETVRALAYTCGLCMATGANVFAVADVPDGRPPMAGGEAV